ncbi:hypothetical protein [Propionibacterium cyclohexanicum]|uniref:hypothetical protein n=1 Tax=Propionibacterium cyclohexanicum TaxID=64702 RepID=UPI000B828492|nr:hypothetical protein [Propionibacterium cyclohexanicum]
MTSIPLLRPHGLVSSPAFSHVAVVPPGATTIYGGGQNAVDAAGALVGGDDGEPAVAHLAVVPASAPLSAA